MFVFTVFTESIIGGQTSIVVSNQSTANANMVGVLTKYSCTNIVRDVWRVGNTGNSTALTTATTDTTTQANELIVAVAGQRGTFSSEQTSWASSPRNTFSIVSETSSFVNTTNIDRAIGFLERIVTSAGTYSTGVTGNSNQFACNIASFREIKVAPVFG